MKHLSTILLIIGIVSAIIATYCFMAKESTPMFIAFTIGLMSWLAELSIDSYKQRQTIK